MSSTVEPSPGSGLGPFRVQKRDTGVLWFAHLPDKLRLVLEELKPGQRVDLLVDGNWTTWERMQPGAGLPTPGVKLVEGKIHWVGIAPHQHLTLELAARERVAVALSTCEIPPTATGQPLFSEYLFADFSGADSPAMQEKAIRLAWASAFSTPEVLPTGFTRGALLAEQIQRLSLATQRGARVLLGQDHQYGVPESLAAELGLSTVDWRAALEALVCGGYGGDGPALDHPRRFASKFNAWLRARGQPPYFWSATKGKTYEIPTQDPRARAESSRFRITETCGSIYGRGTPKPFARVGDNGSVGGQSICGLIHLRELMRRCQYLRIPLRVWPMDGIDIAGPAYEGTHVLIEPYPTAVRAFQDEQSDSNDALAATRMVQEFDRRGALAQLLNLSGLTESEMNVVRREGWILGHSPRLRSSRYRSAR